EFLEAANDPTHEQHEDVHRWIGKPFDPNLIDTAATDQALEALGRRWSRRKA
ncbi:IS1096 element passenger TnpR family protein, partial [Sandarakinorhabdus glacialis]|uniref:IS1096 element passenger TnpR family protein n=1 Tax=Sandarakinorhabdus glacialis TaxID=1614636 RepID=UPI003FCCD559